MLPRLSLEDIVRRLGGENQGLDFLTCARDSRVTAESLQKDNSALGELAKDERGWKKMSIYLTECCSKHSLDLLSKDTRDHENHVGKASVCHIP